MAESIPAEILCMIFTDISISNDDLKSLRLIGGLWSGVATELLFRRICISRLKMDHDSFFNIVSQPHLANAVRVLVWYEIKNDMPLLVDDNDVAAMMDLHEDPDLRLFYHELTKQIRNLFWFSLQNNLATTTVKKGDDLEMTKLRRFMARF
ncbi:hypothetical protein AAE478_010300 [Parahypoxylon ruwenzoriense]